MEELRLPLVESLVSAYKSQSLANVKIIGAQHILETTHAMFRELYRIGLKPENVSIIGKCYSTCRAVYDEMLIDGIDVSPGSFAYSSHLPYDQQYVFEVQQFLSSHIQDLSQYERIIVLDDGGKCINYLSQHTNFNNQVVAIEQTSAGYEAIKNSSLLFPVINIARSPAKLNLESPMIAQAAAERLYMSLKQRLLFPDSALIIGGGAIGQAMKERLSAVMRVVVYDQKQELSNHTADFETLLSSFPLIIGCTGKTSVPKELHPCLSPETILVSVSSLDREFDAVHLRKHLPEQLLCHKDLIINDLLLVNSGFPVNFDGDRENIDPDKIQLTIALITAGILQANTMSDTPAEILPLNPSIEDQIVSEFKNQQTQTGVL